MKTNNNTTIWAIVAILAILCIGGVILFAIYSKSKTQPGYVDSAIFDVMKNDYDWYAESFGSDLVANGRNDKVASAMNSGSSSSNASSSSLGFESMFGV